MEQPISDQELRKYIAIIAKGNQPGQVILRALLNGVFAALGATIGLVMVLVIMASVIRGLDQVPLVNDILEQTKLDVLIENQINQLTSQNKALGTSSTSSESSTSSTSSTTQGSN